MWTKSMVSKVFATKRNAYILLYGSCIIIECKVWVPIFVMEWCFFLGDFCPNVYGD